MLTTLFAQTEAGQSKGGESFWDVMDRILPEKKEEPTEFEKRVELIWRARAEAYNIAKMADKEKQAEKYNELYERVESARRGMTPGLMILGSLAQGDIELARGNEDSALAIFNTVLDSKDQAGLMDGSVLAEYHAKRGEIFSGRRHYDKALSDFAAAISLEENQWMEKATAWKRRGDCYVEMGELDSAMANYDEAEKALGSYGYESFRDEIARLKAGIVARTGRSKAPSKGVSGVLSADEGKALKALVSKVAGPATTGDVEIMRSMTHKSLKAAVGGDKVFEIVIQDMAKRVRDEGLKIVEMTVGDPSQTHDCGADIACIVTLRMVMEANNTKMLSQGYLVALRPKAGGEWTFLDSAGFRRNPLLLQRLLPGLPEYITLPENFSRKIE